MGAGWALIGSPAARLSRLTRKKDARAAGVGVPGGLREEGGCGGQVVTAPLLGEAGQLARAFVELAPRDKRAASLFPSDVSQLRQFLQRLPAPYLTDSGRK